MKVFLSSTYEDLVAYRQAANQALEGLGLQVIRMETFNARPVEPSDACLSEIESCDLFVGIYAHRYGYIPYGSTMSITEAELHHASKHKKQIFCFVVDDNHRWPRKMIESGPGRAKLEALKKEIESKLTRGTFTTPDDLALKLAISVGRWLTRGKTSELAMRFRRVLELMNEGRRYHQYTIAKLAHIAGLPQAGELERYFSGEEEPTFAFVDHFSSVFGVNPSWLKFGEGTPYSTEDTPVLGAISYYERIVSLKPTRIFFIQDESTRRQSGIVLKLTDWKYHTLPRTWPICSDVGGTGRYQIYSFYQLIVRLENEGFSNGGRKLTPPQFSRLFGGQAFPGALIEYPMQENPWWDDFIDIMHEWPIAPKYCEWYGEDFVAVQKIVLEVCKQMDEQPTRRLPDRPPISS